MSNQLVDIYKINGIHDIKPHLQTILIITTLKLVVLFHYSDNFFFFFFTYRCRNSKT